MRYHPQNGVLVAAAIACFVQALYTPWGNEDPGALITGAVGIYLLTRGVAAAGQPALVVAAGCVLAALVIAGDRRILNVNAPVWVVVVLLAFVGFGWGGKIKNYLKSRRS